MKGSYCKEEVNKDHIFGDKFMGNKTLKNKTFKNHWIQGGFFVGLIVLILLTDFFLWRDFLISYYGNA